MTLQEKVKEYSKEIDILMSKIIEAGMPVIIDIDTKFYYPESEEELEKIYKETKEMLEKIIENYKA